MAGKLNWRNKGHKGLSGRAQSQPLFSHLTAQLIAAFVSRNVDSCSKEYISELLLLNNHWLDGWRSIGGFCHVKKKLMQKWSALKHSMQHGIYTCNYAAFKSHSLTTTGSVKKTFIWTLHEVGWFSTKYPDISIKPSRKITLQCNLLDKVKKKVLSGLSWEKLVSTYQDMEHYTFLIVIN